MLCHCVDLHNATTRRTQRTVARGPVRKNWFTQQRLNIRRMVCMLRCDGRCSACHCSDHVLGLCWKEALQVLRLPTLMLSVCGGSPPSITAECQRTSDTPLDKQLAGC